MYSKDYVSNTLKTKKHSWLIFSHNQD